MRQKIVREGNAFYEIDDECMRKKEEQKKKKEFQPTEGATASVAAADSISTAAQEKQYDQDTAVVAAKTVSTADSISIATAAKQKDDPENGIAAIIVVCVSTSIVFASASTVCSCYITHVFIPPELIYTS